MGHLGVEISDVVQITHHLLGRIVGTVRVVIDRLLAESLVHPCPKLALGTSFPLVVNPCGYVGLEGLTIGSQRDERRELRFLDFGAFFFNDYSVLLYQILAFRDETVDTT